MAKKDKITHTSHSENNASLRAFLLIFSVIFGIVAWMAFDGEHARTGAWASFVALFSFIIGMKIQVEWSAQTRM